MNELRHVGGAPDMPPRARSLHQDFRGMMRVHVERQPWEVIAGEARAAYPEECCGLMLGEVGEQSKVVRLARPLRNVARSGRDSRYEMDRLDLAAAQGDASAAGMSVVGIYHSHPDRSPEFSALDLQNSCPWLSYLIVSVCEGQVRESAIWASNFEQTEARREDLEVQSEA